MECDVGEHVLWIQNRNRVSSTKPRGRPRQQRLGRDPKVAPYLRPMDHIRVQVDGDTGREAERSTPRSRRAGAIPFARGLRAVPLENRNRLRPSWPALPVRRGLRTLGLRQGMPLRWRVP